MHEEDNSSGDEFSMLQLALKSYITDDFESALLKMKQTENEQKEKEKEEKVLEEISVEKEKNERAERLRLKMEAEVKEKENQDKLDRGLALKSLDESVNFSPYKLLCCSAQL